MTAAELIIVRTLDLSEADLLRFLAANLFESRLNSGARLVDAIDFQQWLLEVAKAIEIEHGIIAGKGLPVVLDKTCPRCGHIHEGDRECGTHVGGGRFCHCVAEVPA